MLPYKDLDGPLGVAWLVVARGWANGPPCEVLKKTFYQLDLSLTLLSLKTELSKCHVKIHVCVCFKKRFPNGLCLSAIVTKLVAICKKIPLLHPILAYQCVWWLTLRLKTTIFPSKDHSNDWFSMAMLVYQTITWWSRVPHRNSSKGRCKTLLGFCQAAIHFLRSKHAGYCAGN